MRHHDFVVSISSTASVFVRQVTSGSSKQGFFRMNMQDPRTRVSN